jgi:hypothetical protein
MADIKTKVTEASPSAFINKVGDAQKRKDCHELIALMQEITGKPAKMWGPSIVGFGKYHYKYESGREGEMLMTGFSPRKQNLTIYLGSSMHASDLLAKLGKHKTGKGCLYINRLDDVDRKILRTLVAKAVEDMRKRYDCE